MRTWPYDVTIILIFENNYAMFHSQEVCCWRDIAQLVEMGALF